MPRYAQLAATAFFVITVLPGAPWGQADEGPSTAVPVIIEAEADGVQRGAITLDSYSYFPSHIVVQAGKPVELTVTSLTMLTPHNFVLKEQDAGLTVDEDVSAGSRKIIRFTPRQAGLFLFYCDKKLLFFKSHREKGMEGRLEVRE